MASQVALCVAAKGAIRVALFGDPSPRRGGFLDGRAGEQTQDGVWIGIGVLPPLLGSAALLDEALAAPVPSPEPLQLGASLRLRSPATGALGHLGRESGVRLDSRRP